MNAFLIIAIEEFFNQNHSKADGKFTSGDGGSFGGNDVRIAHEVARGIRTGRPFKRSLGESQQYWQHKARIEATLPKRQIRKAHKYIWKMANKINRAQNSPGVEFVQDQEFVWDKHTDRAGIQYGVDPPKSKVGRPSPRITATRKYKFATPIVGSKKKGQKAPKKPDTSNWHRDRVIADTLASLRSSPRASRASSGVATKPAVNKVSPIKSAASQYIKVPKYKS